MSSTFDCPFLFILVRHMVGLVSRKCSVLAGRRWAQMVGFSRLRRNIMRWRRFLDQRPHERSVMLLFPRDWIRLVYQRSELRESAFCC